MVAITTRTLIDMPVQIVCVKILTKFGQIFTNWGFFWKSGYF